MRSHAAKWLALATVITIFNPIGTSHVSAEETVVEIIPSDGIVNEAPVEHLVIDGKPVEGEIEIVSNIVHSNPHISGMHVVGSDNKNGIVVEVVETWRAVSSDGHFVEKSQVGESTQQQEGIIDNTTGALNIEVQPGENNQALIGQKADAVDIPSTEPTDASDTQVQVDENGQAQTGQKEGEVDSASTDSISQVQGGENIQTQTGRDDGAVESQGTALVFQLQADGNTQAQIGQKAGAVDSSIAGAGGLTAAASNAQLEAGADIQAQTVQDVASGATNSQITEIQSVLFGNVVWNSDTAPGIEQAAATLPPISTLSFHTTSAKTSQPTTTSETSDEISTTAYSNLYATTGTSSFVPITNVLHTPIPVLHSPIYLLQSPFGTPATYPTSWGCTQSLAYSHPSIAPNPSYLASPCARGIDEVQADIGGRTYANFGSRQNAANQRLLPPLVYNAYAAAL